MKILFIEDDLETAGFVVQGLERECFSVNHISNGIDGLFEVLNSQYDLLIIDIMLPELDGISIIKKIRQKNIMTPVIVLSAKNTTDDIIHGLRAGSDDYISKPFSFSELLARIRVILRRMQMSFENDTRLTVGDLTLDILKKKVYRGDEEIILQPKEFLLLEYLMRNKGNVITKQMIIDNVWNFDFDPATNVVESKICRLRKKIDNNRKNRLLHTIRGFGYVIKEKYE